MHVHPYSYIWTKNKGTPVVPQTTCHLRIHSGDRSNLYLTPMPCHTLAQMNLPTQLLEFLKFCTISSLTLSFGVLCFPVCWHSFFCIKLNMKLNSFTIPWSPRKLRDYNILCILILLNFEETQGEVISYCASIFILPPSASLPRPKFPV